MKLKVAAIVAFAAMVAAPALFSGEGEEKAEVVVAKAQKSRGQGADENVKKPAGANDPNATAAGAPADKGGEKTRGGVCRVHFDNRTPWFVDVHVDGIYQGQVGPYGDVVQWYPGTQGTIYARASFPDGTFVYWGPQYGVCMGGQYYYRMDM